MDSASLRAGVHVCHGAVRPLAVSSYRSRYRTNTQQNNKYSKRKELQEEIGLQIMALWFMAMHSLLYIRHALTTKQARPQNLDRLAHN